MSYIVCSLSLYNTYYLILITRETERLSAPFLNSVRILPLLYASVRFLLHSVCQTLLLLCHCLSLRWNWLALVAQQVSAPNVKWVVRCECVMVRACVRVCVHWITSSIISSDNKTGKSHKKQPKSFVGRKAHGESNGNVVDYAYAGIACKRFSVEHSNGREIIALD